MADTFTVQPPTTIVPSKSLCHTKESEKLIEFSHGREPDPSPTEHNKTTSIGLDYKAGISRAYYCFVLLLFLVPLLTCTQLGKFACVSIDLEKRSRSTKEPACFKSIPIKRRKQKLLIKTAQESVDRKTERESERIN